LSSSDALPEARAPDETGLDIWFDVPQKPIGSAHLSAVLPTFDCLIGTFSARTEFKPQKSFRRFEKSSPKVPWFE
jgi:hypothetical protein